MSTKATTTKGDKLSSVNVDVLELEIELLKKKETFIKEQKATVEKYLSSKNSKI